VKLLTSRVPLSFYNSSTKLKELVTFSESCVPFLYQLHTHEDVWGSELLAPPLTSELEGDISGQLPPRPA
jgi:hypothetical protein